MSKLVTDAKKYFKQQFDGVIRVELEGTPNAIWIDGRSAPPVVSEKAPANVDTAFCLWRTSQETFERILSPGVRQLEAAYIAGRLAISGDMGVLARLEVGDQKPAS